MSGSTLERLRSLPYAEAREQSCIILREHGFGSFFASGDALSAEEKHDLETTAQIVKQTAGPDGIKPETLLNLAWVDFNLGNFDASLEELNMVIKLSPPNDSSHLMALASKVFLCTKLDQPDKAKEAFEQYCTLIDAAEAGQ